jgi:MFS family permease
MDQKRKRWIVLGGCWLVMAFVFGCGWEPSGVFILPLVKQFGWTRFQVSMLNMALAIALGASCPLVGWLVDRTQAPFWMIFGSAVTGVALLLASIGNSFGALFGAYLMIGTGIAFSTTVPCTYVITNRFDDHRGLALGILVSASSFFGMPMIMLSNHIILVSGWRHAYLILAIPVFLAIPVILLLIRSRPPQKAVDGASGQRTRIDLPGYEVGEALSSSVFWRIAFGFFAFNFIAGGFVIHLVPYLIGIGYTPTHAALVLTLIYGLGTTGKLSISPMADRFGARRTLAADFLALGAGLLFFVGARSVAMLCGFLLLSGLTCGAPMALLPMIQAESLGLRRYGSLNGVLSVAYTLGLAAGPLVAGKIFDVTHSYSSAIALFAVLGLVAAALVVKCPPLSAAEPFVEPKPAFAQSR